MNTIGKIFFEKPRLTHIIMILVKSLFFGERLSNFELMLTGLGTATYISTLEA